MALVGGVNTMLRPEYSIAMSKGQFLSPDGRCKAFDARANGYGRGEGGGVVLLKPLLQAQKDGDDIYALVRGTGINQDGRTPGITLPNQISQEALMQRVYRQAHINPKQVQYVEAHGTGTQAGDVAEAKALGAVLSKDRNEHDPLVVGSVKTNIGHLEAGAGIAGTIKASLSLKNRQIPPSLHFETPNPAIGLDDLKLRVPTTLEPWPLTEGARLVGINSFGYGGTNAHAVLEGWEQDSLPTSNTPPERCCLFPLSARSETALKARVQDYIHFLSSQGEGTSVNLSDLHYSMAHRSTHHDYRLAILANNKEDLIEKLNAYIRAEFVSGIVQERVSQSVQPVFVYTGMGPQWWGMGHELYHSQPMFKKAVDKCEEIFKNLTGWSILEAMLTEKSHSKMDQPRISQPANFILQVALTDLWKYYDVTPSAIVGHSVGEVTAAYASGGLSLEDAISVSYHRSQLQQTVHGQGKMLAIGLPSDKSYELIEGMENLVSVASTNSPTGTTLAGDAVALEEIANMLEADGVFQRMLHVDVAYHSYQMDGLKNTLVSALKSLRPQKPAIPLYSTVTGTYADTPVHDADYWWGNVRQTVQFSTVIQSLVSSGYHTFIEVGPHPALSAYLNEIMNAQGVQGHVRPSLHRRQDEHITFLEGVASLHCLGYPVSWRALGPQETGRFIKLPRYPWQREHYFIESKASKVDRLGTSGHPLLGQKVISPLHQWQVLINNQIQPYLEDHKVTNTIIFPGAAYVEAGLAIDKELFDDRNTVIESIRFPQALVLDESTEPILNLIFNQVENQFQIFSSNTDSSKWTLHAQGTLLDGQIEAEPAPIDLSKIRARCPNIMEAENLYSKLAERGLQYGPDFKGIQKLFWCEGEVLAEIQANTAVHAELLTYRLHPALLDACFQALIAGVDTPNIDDDVVFVPVEIERVQFYDATPAEFLSYGQITQQTDKILVGNLILCNEQGNVFAKVKGLRCQALPQAHRHFENWLYAFQWEAYKQKIDTTKPTDGTYLVFSSGKKTSQQIIEGMTTLGYTSIEAIIGDSFKELDQNCFQMSTNSLTDMEKLLSKIQVQNLQGIIYLWNLDARDRTGKGDCVDLLHMVQSLTTLGVQQIFRLCLFTRGSQKILDHEPLTTVGSALWGLGRVIINEHPELDCTLIDLDPQSKTIDTSILREILQTRNNAEEWGIRQETLYVHRLLPMPVIKSQPVEPKHPLADKAFELTIEHPGDINNLQFRERERRAPEVDEVEIQVHSVGLNFKDVMKTMGMLSDVVLSGTFVGDALGLECSGTVVRIGPGVTTFKEGDAVIATSNTGCFRSYITLSLNEAYVIHKPAPLSMTEAPLLIPYLAVYYGLHDIAHLCEDDTILIHAATGGVGLAAIQYAKHVGVEIYATAGSPKKRDYLRTLGITHIMDSRSLKFADDIMDRTQGEGVDVVLNSLSGEALIKSFEALAPYGRFIEIGKRDIDKNTGLHMRPFNKNLTFSAVDVDRMMAERRDLSYRLLHDICHELNVGTFKALPAQAFLASQVVEAFQCMARAKHIGKITVTMQDPTVWVVPQGNRNTTISPEGTYLVTGGLSGFGLETAKWLATKGAHTLVLASRGGATLGKTKAGIHTIKSAGTNVSVIKADVSKKEDVRKLFETMTDLPPLKGVIHAAGVIEDGLLKQLNALSFETVIAPKASGAWLLHEEAQGLKLDFFVLYSSVSALVGNTGQANYAAANAFLDGLANYRRSIGLPALSINWGVITQVGMAARDPDVLIHLENQGIRGISPTQALEVLDYLLKRNETQIGVVDLDWEKWREANPVSGQSPRFAHLVNPKNTGGSKTDALREQLSQVPCSERPAYMANMVAKQVAGVLRLPQEKLDIHQPLDQLGVDSLMAVEIQTVLQMAFGLSLSAMELMKGSSVALLSQKLMNQIGIEAEATDANMIDEVDNMDDEEIDAFLKQMVSDSSLKDNP